MMPALRLWAIEVLAVLGVAGALGCWRDPRKQEVVEEFHRILLRNGIQNVDSVVREVFSGEGGANYVEKHVVFDLLPRQDVHLSGAFMPGEHLKAGETLRGGEIVITYQDVKSQGLVPTSWTLERKPRPDG
jgi:hypothetical protein